MCWRHPQNEDIKSKWTIDNNPISKPSVEEVQDEDRNKFLIPGGCSKRHQPIPFHEQYKIVLDFSFRIDMGVDAHAKLPKPFKLRITPASTMTTPVQCVNGNRVTKLEGVVQPRYVVQSK
jgi:hypothetical protein